MILFFLITLIYGSNSIGLKFKTSILLPNATNKSPSLMASIKSNPKKFISEVQNLDPEALQRVISLLEELREQSQAREAHLIEDLTNKNDALNDANSNVLSAEEALGVANAAIVSAQEKVDAAKNVVTAKEQEAASVQADLNAKRQIHSDKQDEKDTSQTTHDDEIPGLDDEQQVLTDVINMLKGLPDAAQWKEVGHVSGSTVADRAFWNGKCGPFGDLTTEDIVLVHMGEVKDYYKPTSDMSLCHFLSSHEYSWSSTEDGNYAVPDGHYPSTYLGGSSGFTAQTNEDGRSYVSFWGYDSAAYGGCCHYKSKVYGGTLDGGAWHREFTLYVKQFA